MPRDGTSVGEFEVRGPWVTAEYYDDPTPDRFRDGWLRTGDVGTVDAQGFLQITDRTKDVIKTGGEWISSVELENALMAHPGVFEAAVVAVPDARWDERPLACVVLVRRRFAERRGACGVARGQGAPLVGPGALVVRRARSRRRAWASSTRRCCGPGTRRASSTIVTIARQAP